MHRKGLGKKLMRKMAPYFGSYTRRIHQCILVGYVPVDTTQ